MKKVLLIDDDAISNFLCTELLKRIGGFSKIHSALNGQVAINWLNDYYQETGLIPDFIFLDLNMPIMGGFDFLEAFQNLDIPQKGKIKIIIITSSDDAADISKAKKMGIDDYFTKPISFKKLEGTLMARP